MMKKIIETQNLSIGYNQLGKKTALFPPINVDLNEGDVVALAGPNGAGKTTLFKTLSSTLAPLDGQIFLFGKEIRNYSAAERSKLYSIVLTERPDDMFLKVFDVVALGRYPYLGLWAKLKKNDYQIIEKSLDVSGVLHLIDRPFRCLSDGERQKVMISKALAQDTPLIFMDEPAAFLDYPSKIELMTLMLKLSREQGKTIMFSSHDLDILLRTADKLWIVANNKPLISGVPEDIALNGLIDNYFSRNGMKFDLETAQFTNLQPTKGKIGVLPQDVRLQWVARALTRKGFAVVEPQDGIVNIDFFENQYRLQLLGKQYFAESIEVVLNLIETIIVDKVITINKNK